jgi:phosphoribosylaminoimidazole (AIR) synthetase
MFKKNIIIGLFLLCFLNGCAQSTALLGPAYTLVSTGNVYQAGFSYGSSKAIKEITGKTLTENIKSFVDNENTVIEIKEENQKEFIALAKNNIAKASKVLNLASQ